MRISWLAMPFAAFQLLACDQATSTGTTTSIAIGEELVLTYTFNDAGCETGKHKFSDSISYCEALRSDSLNNHCALEQRQAEWEEECVQQFSSIE